MPPLIAVVNDDTMFLDLMRDLLTDNEYRVSIHRGAMESYGLLKAECPDLIVLDIRMETPEAGWQLLEMLQLDPTTVRIPVLVCSADAIFLRAKAAHLRAQGCDILEKPFDLTMLLEKIAAGLAGEWPN